MAIAIIIDYFAFNGYCYGALSQVSNQTLSAIQSVL